VGGRWLRVRGGAAALALLAGLGAGCSWDELTESGIRKAGAAPAGEGQAAGAGKAGAAGPAAPRPNWWAGARSLSREDADASIVGCRIGGSLQFMRETDCLARGGEPGR
jgi:hypothetical protein